MNEAETIQRAKDFIADGVQLGSHGLCRDALESLDQAISVCQAFKGESLFVKTLAAQALSNKGAALGDMDWHKEAVKCYDAAIAIYRQLAETDDNPGILENCAVAVMNKGWSFINLEQEDAGFRCHAEALDLRRQLVAEGYAWVLPDVARSLYNVGEGYFKAERFAAAIPAFNEAADILQKLIASGQTEHEDDFAYVLAAWADTLQKLGQLEEALDISNEAIALFVKLAGTKENPKLASALAAALDGQEMILKKVEMAKL